MSNDHDPRESSQKLSARPDEAPHTGAEWGGRASQDRSSRRPEDLGNVARETTESRSECLEGGCILGSAKLLYRTAESSQGDSSWKTIEHSQVNTVSRTSESLWGTAAAEPGSSLWRKSEDFAGRSCPEAASASAKPASAPLWFDLGVGTRDRPSEYSADKHLWEPEETASSARGMWYESGLEASKERPAGSRGLGAPWKSKTYGTLPFRLDTISPRTPPTFNSLALDVSYAGLDTSGLLDRDPSRKTRDEEPPQFWEDFSVVECLERRLASNDESTPEERVETLKEVLAETDIHEGDGAVSDFLFHVAKTKYGKIYIRVIRTMLLNRGRTCTIGGYRLLSSLLLRN